MKTEELEQQLTDLIKKDDVSFAQNDIGFDMPKLSGLLSTSGTASLPLMAVGSALAGTAGGFVSGFLGTFGGAVAGLPSMVAGALLKVTIAKSGKASDIANGIMLSGISQLVSGLLGGSLGGIFSQPTELSDNIKNQYKQEMPCNDIHKLRSDVSW